MHYLDNRIVNSYQHNIMPLFKDIIAKWSSYVTPAEVIRILEGDVLVAQKLNGCEFDIANTQQYLTQQVNTWIFLLRNNARKVLQNIYCQCVKQIKPALNLSKKIDSVVLHKIWAH